MRVTTWIFAAVVLAGPCSAAAVPGTSAAPNKFCASARAHLKRKVLLDTDHTHDSRFRPPRLHEVEAQQTSASIGRKRLSIHYWATGKAVIGAAIDSAGRVVYTGIVQSTGDAWLDETARLVAEGYRFDPATLSGKPVWVCVMIPISFAWSE